MAFTFRDRDRGYARLQEAFASMPRKTLTVGIHADEGAAAHANGKLSVAEIGTVHEFGVPGKTPQRSFVRGWFDKSQKPIADLMRRAAQGVKSGKNSVDKALSLVGMRFVGDIQKRIASNIPPALKQSTIDRKGSSVALIDSGQLRSSIGFQVR